MRDSRITGSARPRQKQTPSTKRPSSIPPQSMQSFTIPSLFKGKFIKPPPFLPKTTLRHLRSSFQCLESRKEGGTPIYNNTIPFYIATLFKSPIAVLYICYIYKGGRDGFMGRFCLCWFAVVNLQVTWSHFIPLHINTFCAIITWTEAEAKLNSDWTWKKALS